jgi:hypothetical protein
MTQIGDLQPQAPTFPNVPPADAGEKQQALHQEPAEEEPLFVSPPPVPWPRVFPGL